MSSTTPDLPIALRRTRRSGGVVFDASNGQDSHTTQNTTTTSTSLPSCLAKSIAATPRKRGRPKKKRVRFSDPGPIFENSSSSSPAPSTGLTPLIRRTSLSQATASPSASASQRIRRRHSTPARPFRGDDDGESEVIMFLPLRQVIEGRVQRRIRRNHLSEEMNAVHLAKKRAEDARRAEMERLQEEVREKDEEIRRLSGGEVAEGDRVSELEQQVEELRRELDSRSANGDESRYDWTLAARDPFNPDEYTSMLEQGLASDPMDADDDDDEFGETTIADLQCSTPSRSGGRSARSTRCVGTGSFPTPPATSPTAMPMDVDVRLPMTPSSRFSTPRSTSHSGVQVAMADPEKEALEQDVASLQLEIVKLTGTLETYQHMASQLQEKLAPYSNAEDDVDELASSPAPTTAAETDTPSQLTTINSSLNNLLSTLSTRTTSLLSLTSSLSSLGFPGTTAPTILTSISTALRTARLELEYLSPGESTLPLASSGAATLDLLLSRLRELSRAVKEADDTIDMYHEQELSLRKQLGARVDVADGLGRDVKRLEERVRDGEQERTELEVGCERLRGAVERHSREVRELTELVGRMEREREEGDAEKNGVIKELEERLGVKAEEVKVLKDQIGEMGRAQGVALRLRDARVVELRSEVARVSEQLREAGETIRGLKVEGSKLEKRLEGEKERAREVVGGLREELERVVRASQDMLASTPKKKDERDLTSSRENGDTTSVSDQTALAEPGEYLSGGLARRSSGKGRKRRRYDSGLGFLDEDEEELEGTA